MKKLQEKMQAVFADLQGEKAHLVVLVVAIALFVLSAAAPNATIGIGR